jgi:hypothetical protein
MIFLECKEGRTENEGSVRTKEGGVKAIIMGKARG